jgi:hypothetical protein
VLIVTTTEGQRRLMDDQILHWSASADNPAEVNVDPTPGATDPKTPATVRLSSKGADPTTVGLIETFTADGGTANVTMTCS